MAAAYLCDVGRGRERVCGRSDGRGTDLLAAPRRGGGQGGLSAVTVNTPINDSLARYRSVSTTRSGYLPYPRLDTRGPTIFDQHAGAHVSTVCCACSAAASKQSQSVLALSRISTSSTCTSLLTLPHGDNRASDFELRRPVNVPKTDFDARFQSRPAMPRRVTASFTWRH